MGDDDPVVALLTPIRILAVPLFDIAFIGMVRVVTGKVHPLREWLVDTGKGHIHPRFEAPGLSEAPSLMLILDRRHPRCVGHSAEAGEAVLILLQAAGVLAIIAVPEGVGRERPGRP